MAQCRKYASANTRRCRPTRCRSFHRTPRAKRDIKIYKKLSRTQLASEAAGEPEVQRPAVACALLRHERDASGRSVAGVDCGGEVCSHAVDRGGPGLDHALPGRVSGYSAGLHRRPQPFTEHTADDDRGRRPGLDAEAMRRREQRRHRRGLRPGRQRVQRLQYRSPALCPADSGGDAGPDQREEAADHL